jgi:hypothetical protein
VGFAGIFQWIHTREEIEDLVTTIVNTSQTIVMNLPLGNHLMATMQDLLSQTQNHQILIGHLLNQLLNAECV